MRIKEQFEKSANSYEKYSKIQSIGTKLLIDEIKSPLNNIADLGCGSGRIYKEIVKNSIKFNNFYGYDFAKSMLNLHPKGENIFLEAEDFNNIALFNKMRRLNLDLIISASALQWAKDIEFTLKECAKSAKLGYFFIFTSNSFKTIHKTINIKSPIVTKEQTLKAFLNNYNPIKVEELEHKLYFDDTLEMLRYIKKSGVSGGLNLSYKKMKYLIKNYPIKYLEFETLLLIGESRCLR